jgi:antitoxin component YwqK of YwqJK toxin-antitoxin module
VAGKLSGRATAWNEEGRVVEVADYEVRGGLVYGRFRSWYPDGRKLAEGEVLNEELHGTLVFYDEKGRKTVERYEKGVRVDISGPNRQP